MSVVAIGCGSLMLPNDDSERLLDVERRWAPKAQTEAIVRRIPKTSPGKKPERTAATGNLAQFACDDAGEVDDGDSPGEAVPVEAGGAVGATSCFASMSQVVPLLQIVVLRAF
ncbi:hypothetical protein M7I_0542 [Glarea lozoyensis 74030]|uniref:Uncharacterized protein n=1 Tax=Glarea lozoyensis (strain ATCC 74030 / MF5533) TaxID=1104152 RepID=H0EDT5_GLAL7|nr:hypothetical protein M7I_0542 [Glarea lozoyensis 74030]